jgi:hypothetical protein
MANEPCEECKKLDHEASLYLDSWRVQSAMNRQEGNRTKAAREEVERLKRAYESASARARLHKATDHPESGYTVTVQDIDQVYGS